jgi:hypothetical protein
MKKNLKKYNDFINESLTRPAKLPKYSLDRLITRDDISALIDLRADFLETILDMADFFPGYFSDMCKKQTDPEADYNSMQSLMDKKGWNFESIKNLFSEEANELSREGFEGWFNGNGQLGSNNGHCDAYLYFTAKKLGLGTDIVQLGGDGWALYNEGDELWIRYSYGYHQTQYGQLMLQQIGYTVERFKEEAKASYIKEYWNQSLLNCLEEVLAKQSGGKKYPLSNCFTTNFSLKELLSGIDIKQYTVVEDDRMIIFTSEITDLINDYQKLANVTAEDVAKGLIKQYAWIEIDMQEVKGDVVIWGKFKVDF